MKALFTTCFAAALVMFTSNALATVWRVNNNSTTPSISANFTALSTAAGSALVLAGDTLYVEGSATSYGTLTLNKRLTIIGPGYFLASNDTTQAFQQRSIITSLTVNASAAGSVFAGMTILNTTAAVNANDVVFDRCHFDHSSGAPAIRINTGVLNTIIRRSFLHTSMFTSEPSIDILANCLNIVVDNNIIKCGNKNSTSSGMAIRMNGTATAIIRNNTINGPVNVSNAIFDNNIHLTGYFIQNTTMVSVFNNIGNSTQFGTANGNQSSVNMTNVFTYGPGNENIDNHYSLKAGSPALGAGVSGVDCGAFGGTNPYVLSGMPAIPAIFGVTLGSNVVTSASGLQINTKSKAHD